MAPIFNAAVARGKPDCAMHSCAMRNTTAPRRTHNRHMAETERVLAFPQAPDAIELRHLRAFVAVAQELSFSRAADRLHISQSALSRQIRALEEFLGCELLRRSTHNVELTIAGDALLDRAQKLLEDVDAAVTVTQSIGGELAARLTELWAPLFSLAAGESTLEQRRQAYEDFHSQFSPPPEVKTKPVNAGGVHAFMLGAESEASPRILYFHGGGYMLGSAFGYRPMIGALALAAGATALAPEYRLAPEHPFPAALDDALTAYEWLLASGTPAESIVIAGDSSGGGLAMTLLLTLRERGLQLPGGTLLFCPWLDLSGSSLRALVSEEDDAAVLLNETMRCADAYLAGHSVDDPVLNPLTTDLAGLPPMLIQAATGDPQREDAHILAERARLCGVDARLELYPVDTHAFQFFWSFLPEAMEGMEHAGQFIRCIHSQSHARAGDART
jgi:acetyl esterase/lipase